MKKKTVERRLKRYFQAQTEYLPTLAVEGVTNHRRAYSARRMQKPLLIALTAYLSISIAVVAWVAVRYMDEVEPAATTAENPNVTEPAFEIRRPSAEQDALFSMERFTEIHATADFINKSFYTFDDFIQYIYNPLRKPIVLRVSIVDEQVGTTLINDWLYYTEICCKIEDIIWAPSDMNFQAGESTVTLTERRGIQDGKMWYFEGDLPMMDCYEYYLIGYQDDSALGYSFLDAIPIVDCYEQYEETMDHYGFDLRDLNRIVPDDYLRHREFIEECKNWFENSNKLRMFQDQLTAADSNQFWKNLCEDSGDQPISSVLADQIKPYDSIENIVSILGNPQEIEAYSYQNVLIYYLTADGSQTINICYDYLTNTVYHVRRNYAYKLELSPDKATAQSLQVGMTYDEVIQIMGVPYFAQQHPYEDEYIASVMEYSLADKTDVQCVFDHTQTEPVVTSIRIN